MYMWLHCFCHCTRIHIVCNVNGRRTLKWYKNAVTSLLLSSMMSHHHHHHPHRVAPAAEPFCYFHAAQLNMPFLSGWWCWMHIQTKHMPIFQSIDDDDDDDDYDDTNERIKSWYFSFLPFSRTVQQIHINSMRATILKFVISPERIIIMCVSGWWRAIVVCLVYILHTYNM